MRPANDNWFTEDELFTREIFESRRAQINLEAKRRWGDNYDQSA